MKTSATTIGNVLPDLCCDVLIIGGGIAGAWCALKLARRGIRTVKSIAIGMARHKVPKLVELVSELPRTATGKVARHLLRQRESTSLLLPASIAS